MSKTHQTPLTVIQNGVCYYYEENGDSTVRHEGTIEVYDNWVRLVGGMPTWVPRERVDQVHEN